MREKLAVRFSKNVSEIVRARRSSRSYRPEPIAEAAVCELEAAAGSLDRGLAAEPARFALVRWTDEARREVRLGDYGIISRPRNFLVGAIRESDTAYTSYGYLLEQLVLKATDLGLGTCWLGYFDPRFTGEFKPGPGELMPAVCVVGPTAENPGMKDRLVRSVVGATRRRNWSDLFWDGKPGTPLSAEAAGPYAEPLEVVRLSPSAGNAQPWRVVREAGSANFHFFLKPVNARYEQRRIHDVDVGIAMCHFELSCRELGLAGAWTGSAPGVEAPPGARHIFTWQPAP
jgi:nitroreductase